MKILVLGCKGMLGTDLMLRLSAAHEVTGKDVEDFDISLEQDCRRLIEDCSMDVVINAAAYTNVDACETDRDRCFAVNATGVRNIALACRGKGIRIVHFSTDYVFDGMKQTPYVEEDKTAPLNVYGASKLEGERFLQSLADHWLLIRTAWLYGEHGQNFVRTILKKALTVKALDVVDDQIGSPTSTRDLAAAVERLVDGRYEGLFHLTNEGSCSWYEFACKILHYAGMNEVVVRPMKTVNLTRPAVRPAWSVLSSRKFSMMTGNTMEEWKDSLKEHLERTGFLKYDDSGGR